MAFQSGFRTHLVAHESVLKSVQMTQSKKALTTALKKTEELPNNWFGAAEASLEDLPSVRRSKRVRKNIYIESDTAEALELFCKKHGVPFTDVANDILSKYVNSSKKKSG